MNISAANISPIICLPTANDNHSQSFDSGRVNTDNNLVDSRRTRQESTGYVLRGEVLESKENEKRYQPQFNQQIDPRNRGAIYNYQATSVSRIESEALGQLIDRFI